MTTITLYETHTQEGIFYQWCLFSKWHFWFKRISAGAFHKLWASLATRSYRFRCLPVEDHGCRQIFKTEFFL